MDFKAYIFDLDGTLLDTLPDLVNLTNMVLDSQGWPQRTREQILSYIGDGGRMLLKRAAPSDISDEALDAAFAEWEHLYPTLGHSRTKPYAGMTEALLRIKDSGAKLGVLSNKIHSAAQQVIAEHFPGIFDAVRGESPETPRKPNPEGLRRLMATFDVTPEQTAYVGDSATDMEVAHLTRAFAIGVTWGYQRTEALEAAGAQLLIDHPSQLV